jgi:hypothetical protein
MSVAIDRDRPRMQLLEWQRIDKGALVGRAMVLLPSGLQISDIGNADGQLVKDDRGKIRYRSALKWATRELQDGFSAALITLIEAEHGAIDGGSA